MSQLEPGVSFCGRHRLNVPTEIAAEIRPRSLIDAHVVHFHAERQRVPVDALLTAPRAADGDVENEVKRAVERPDVATAFFAREREVLAIVDEPPDTRRRPLNRIHVE